MQEEAIAAIAGPARRPSSLQLGLAVLPLLEGNAIAEAITRHHRDLQLRLEALVERRTAAASLSGPGEELPFHVAAMFELGVAQITAELEWIRRFAADFDRHRRKERTGT